MTTVATLADRIINRARSGSRETLLTLGSAVATTGATTITLSANAPAGLVEGVIIEIDDEIMHVVSASTSNTSVTVLRGMWGSTAATHLNGAIIRIEPRYHRHHIIQLMKEEVESWHPHIYAAHEQELVFEPGVATVDSQCPAGSDVIKILQAQVEPLSDEDWRHVRVHLIQDPDTSQFTSGYGVALQRPSFGIERTVHVIYARTFDVSSWTSATDLQTDALLPTTVEDLLVLGVLWRVKLDDEVGRTDITAQGQPRSAQEVPPTHSMQAAEALEKARGRMIAREARRLNAKYPIRFS